MNIETISWQNNRIRIIDQTKLPGKLQYLYIDSLRELWRAIKELKVRGAPALGAAAGLGIYLAVKDSRAKTFGELSAQLDLAAKYLASSRPTARNLFWGIERVCRVAGKNRNAALQRIKELIFQEALRIIEEDKLSCRRIGELGSALIDDRDTVLTVCNAGILATIDYGTALGVIYRAVEKGKRIKVYASETRPLLQGARLTSWELKNKKIPVILICDNMAATLMQQGKVAKVITGADRIAANGDSANKIGTYSLAVLCAYHKIPFYIAAPASTFDLGKRSGRDIIIEERDPREITGLFFRQPIAPRGVEVYNPAFDVTPHQLITAIITDKGIIRKPCRKNIKRVLK
jgi:methylthioribose-1-phosphate isomerase